jgi:anthranilate 1,2-dioxygenase ferredoxin reductase component
VTLLRRSTVVDEFCRTSSPDVFAAGDVTRHLNPLLGRHIRVESWQVAENQPAKAALNMLGQRTAYAELPWLWSDQFGCNLQTLGIFDPQHRVVCRGDPEGEAFSLLGLDSDGRLRAAALVNGSRDM